MAELTRKERRRDVPTRMRVIAESVFTSVLAVAVTKFATRAFGWEIRSEILGAVFAGVTTILVSRKARRQKLEARRAAEAAQASLPNAP